MHDHGAVTLFPVVSLTPQWSRFPDQGLSCRIPISLTCKPIEYGAQVANTTATRSKSGLNATLPGHLR
jgi:hypothetical protein